MRYFLRLAYKGTHFHGWQVQPNGISIQQKINEGLSTLLRHPLECLGCGRTDTGVHAADYYAHFDAPEIADTKSFVHKLNALVGKDISIIQLIPVSDTAHARFDAIERTYRYHVHFVKDPFVAEFSHQLSFKPDMEAMNMAAGILLTQHDFASFCKAGAQSHTTFCRVYKAAWIEKSNDHWYFEISADRFLRNMVRAIVGSLLDVGYGKISVEDFQHIILQKNRSDAGMSVPALGLFLHEIKYPYLSEQTA